MLMQVWVVDTDPNESIKKLDFVRLKRTYATINYIFKHRHDAEITEPVVLQWQNHYRFLLCYQYLIARELTIVRGMPFLNLRHFSHLVTSNPTVVSEEHIPWWFDYSKYINSHRAALLCLDYIYYSRYTWDVPLELNFWWPYNPKNEVKDYSPFYQTNRKC